VIQTKIEDIVEILDIDPIIDLEVMYQDKTKSEKLKRSYVITNEVHNLFVSVLEKITYLRSPETLKRLDNLQLPPKTNIKKSCILVAQMGKGKSYFLLMLSDLLENLADPDKMCYYKTKFEAFPEILFHLERLENKPYFPVVINATSLNLIGSEFDKIIFYKMKEIFQQKFQADIFISKFEKAIAQLNHLKSREHLIKAIENIIGLSYDEIIESLSSNDYEIQEKMFREYIKAHEDIIGSAPGFIESLNENDLIKIIELSKEIVKKNGYQGLVFVIDEFSSYMLAAYESGRINTDLSKAQTLAEFCNKINSDCLMICASHEPFKTITKEKVNKNIAEKVGDRWDENLPTLTGWDFHLLAPTVLKLKENGKKYAELISNGDIKDNLKEIQSLADEYKIGDLKYYYPLHPTIIVALPKLSELGIKGFGARTLFGYILHHLPKELSKDAVKPNNNLNLALLCTVYDYFKPSLEKFYPETVEVCNKFQSNTLQYDIARLLATCLIQKKQVQVEEIGLDLLSSLNSNLSAKEIALFLLEDEDQIEQNIEYMYEKTDYINKETDRFTGITKYELIIITKGPDPQKCIDEKLDLINPAKIMQDYINNEVDLRNFKVSTPIDREIEQNSYLLNDISNKLELSTSSEIRLTYIFPDLTEWKRIKIIELAKDLVKDEDNIIIGIPKDVSMIDFKVFREYGASHECWLETEDEKRKNIFKTRLTKHKISIKKMVEEFTEPTNWEFYCKGAQSPLTCNQNPFRPTDLINEILNEIYPKFPKLTCEQLQTRNTTNKIIRTLIIPGFRDVPITISSEDDRHIIETIEPMGLVDKVTPGQRVELKEPSNGVGKEIWNIINNITREDIQNPIEIVYNQLIERPYGLNDLLIELYLSAYLSLEIGILFDQNHNRITQPLDKIMKQISEKKDKKYLIRRNKTFTDEEKNFLIQFWGFLDEIIKKDPIDYSIKFPTKFNLKEQENVCKEMEISLKEAKNKLDEIDKNFNYFKNKFFD